MFYRSLLLCVCLYAIHFKLYSEQLNIPVRAEAAILINADTGTVLYEKNPHTLYYPASITKISTAAYTLRTHKDKLDVIIAADQDSVASITEGARQRSNYACPAYWLVPGCSHIGIKTGEELTLRDLLFGMMVASGNDASNVVAKYVGGTIPNFMTAVNAYLKEIGCQNTTFYNPHGLHHPQHQTTASDMALLTKEAMKDPLFKEIVSTVRYKRPKTNKQSPTTLIQGNRLLCNGKSFYSKAIGVKTGGTSMAGSTLVAAAQHEDRTLIAVLLKNKVREEMFQDAIKMFETAFNQAKVHCVLLKAGPQKFILDLDGAAKPLSTYLKEDISIEYFPAEEPNVQCLLYWHVKTLPIAQDQMVGELHFQLKDGELVQKVPLLAQEDVSATWLWSLQHLFGKSAFFKWAAAGLIILVLCGAFIQLRRRF